LNNILTEVFSVVRDNKAKPLIYMKPCATFEKQTTVVTTKIAELDTCSYKVTQKNGPHKEVETP